MSGERPRRRFPWRRRPPGPTPEPGKLTGAPRSPSRTAVLLSFDRPDFGHVRFQVANGVKTVTADVPEDDWFEIFGPCPDAVDEAFRRLGEKLMDASAGVADPGPTRFSLSYVGDLSFSRLTAGRP